MFNKQREVNKMTKAYALVTGDKVEVQLDKSIRDVAQLQAQRNRHAPSIRAKVYEVRYDNVGDGKLANVRLGKYVF